MAHLVANCRSLRGVDRPACVLTTHGSIGRNYHPESHVSGKCVRQMRTSLDQQDELSVHVTFLADAVRLRDLGERERLH